MDLITAMQTNDTFTENAMPTHSTAGSKLVDLFFKMGASRAAPAKDLRALFAEAYGEDKLLAVKAAFYNRDVRSGQGERRSFQEFFRYLIVIDPEVAKLNIPNVPFYGRWDDLLYAAADTVLEETAYRFYLDALLKGDKLAAKWAPREGKAGSVLANKLRTYAGLDWKQYRQLVAGNTDVVEQYMCLKAWHLVDYNKVPSKAIHKYRKAWYRNDEPRYKEWVAALSAGSPEAKINAGAIFPHEIVRPFVQSQFWIRYSAGVTTVAEETQLQAQWNALPNYMPEGFKIMPICDVSGSMHGEPMEVSIGLGMYLAERNEGPFKNAFITFSNKPQLLHLKAKDLRSRVEQVAKCEWGMNTNLEAVFALLLNKAVDAGVGQEAMPDVVLILSDMQFDQCVKQPTDNAFAMITRQYEEAGYRMPKLVFWNLRDSTGVPVKFDQRETALVSGFSPSIMKNLLGGKNMTPLNVVLDTLNSERYAQVKV